MWACSGSQPAAESRRSRLTRARVNWQAMNPADSTRSRAWSGSRSGTVYLLTPLAAGFLCEGVCGRPGAGRQGVMEGVGVLRPGPRVVRELRDGLIQAVGGADHAAGGVV